MKMHRLFSLILITAVWLLKPASAQPRADLDLYEAIRTNRPEVVQGFLRRDGNPNAIIANSPMGNVPVLRVAVAGHRDAIALALLQAGARMETAGVGLGDVSVSGMDEALRYVLAEQEPTDLSVIKGALDAAVTSGHYDSVEALLDYIKEKRLPILQLSQNAIYSAIGKDDIARLLLDNGATVRSGALRAAASWSSPGMMRYLLQLGADPFESYQDSFTAIDYVWDSYVGGTSSRRQAATFKLFDLLALGATSERVDRSVAVDGDDLLSRIASPSEKLTVAAGLGFYDTVSEILSGPTSLDATVLTEATAAALRSHWDDIARLLIEKGAPPGGGPLHIAVRNSSPGMVRLLLKRGADPNELVNDYAPIDYWFRNDPAVKPARSSTNSDVLDELIMGGANVCGLVEHRAELAEQAFSYSVLWNSAPECWPEQR